MPMVRWVIDAEDVQDCNMRNSYFKIDDNHILEDAWVLTLKSEEKNTENVMMEEFLRELGGKSEDLKKLWQESDVIISMNDELKDLLRIYTDLESGLMEKEESCLEELKSYMKIYLHVSSERKKMSNKLETLKDKIQKIDQRGECEEDE